MTRAGGVEVLVTDNNNNFIISDIDNDYADYREAVVDADESDSNYY